MRQVPTFHPAPSGIVGDGRVVHPFLADLQPARPSRPYMVPPKASGPIEAFAECRTGLVLIRDAEIVPFLNEWPLLPGRVWRFREGV
jgi:hypothetical protein